MVELNSSRDAKDVGTLVFRTNLGADSIMDSHVPRHVVDVRSTTLQMIMNDAVRTNCPSPKVDKNGGGLKVEPWAYSGQGATPASPGKKKDGDTRGQSKAERMQARANQVRGETYDVAIMSLTG